MVPFFSRYLAWLPPPPKKSFLFYLQAGTLIWGILANSMENGATVIGFEELTVVGSRLGIFPSEVTFNVLPFRSMVWLCKSPSLAVRWYSSLGSSLLLCSGGSLICFVLGFLCLCLECRATNNALLRTLMW